MMVGDNLLELQVARPREPQELASFFVGQAVQQDGAVHMASRVDPLFLLLPVLCKHATKWCPLDQALAEGGCGGLRGLRHLDANKLCDVNGEWMPFASLACEGTDACSSSQRPRAGTVDTNAFPTVSAKKQTPRKPEPPSYATRTVVRPHAAHL